jgi:hypothetical protein
MNISNCLKTAFIQYMTLDNYVRSDGITENEINELAEAFRKRITKIIEESKGGINVNLSRNSKHGKSKHGKSNRSKSKRGKSKRSKPKPRK